MMTLNRKEKYAFMNLYSMSVRKLIVEDDTNPRATHILLQEGGVKMTLDTLSLQEISKDVVRVGHAIYIMRLVDERQITKDSKLILIKFVTYSTNILSQVFLYVNTNFIRRTYKNIKNDILTIHNGL